MTLQKPSQIYIVQNIFFLCAQGIPYASFPGRVSTSNIFLNARRHHTPNLISCNIPLDDLYKQLTFNSMHSGFVAPSYQ